MLDKMRVFVKVAETRSFSAAGKQLQVAPSSISRNIDSLEAELGVTLFIRSTRSLTLTAEGDAFLLGARDVILRTEDLVASTKSGFSKPEGVLRVSTFESFGRIHVCEWVSRFVQAHPKTQIEFELENNVIDLLTSEVDLAIRVGRPEDSNLKARHLLSNRTILCASPSYIATHGLPNSPDDLIRHNCLALGLKRQTQYWYFKQNSAMTKVRIQGNIRSSGGTPLLAAALNGAGITLLANWMVAEHLAAGELIVVLPEWVPSLYSQGDGDVYAVYPTQKYMKPILRAFIDHLTVMAATTDF